MRTQSRLTSTGSKYSGSLDLGQRAKQKENGISKRRETLF